MIYWFIYSLKPILEEEKIFIEAIRDLNYQASQLQNEENLSVVPASDEFSDSSLPPNTYHRQHHKHHHHHREFHNRHIQNDIHNLPSSDISPTVEPTTTTATKAGKIDAYFDLTTESNTQHLEQSTTLLHSTSHNLSPSTTAIGGPTSPLSNHSNDSTKKRSDALLEASIRAVVTDPAPNMQSILTWMHSVSTTGALVPIPSTTSYLPRGLGQEKSISNSIVNTATTTTTTTSAAVAESTTTANSSSYTTPWEGSGISYYNPTQLSSQSSTSSPKYQSQSTSRHAHGNSLNLFFLLYLTFQNYSNMNYRICNTSISTSSITSKSALTIKSSLFNKL